MRKFAILVTLASLTCLLLSACGGGGQPAVSTVEDFIKALVAKDANRLSALSCATWEQDALTDLDSFRGVDTRLEGLACAVSGKDGGTTLVSCQGKIIASYNNEDQTFDLSVRTYQVVLQGGDYLVCGYR